MEGKTLATGGLALIVGLLLGYVVSPSGPDLSEIENALGDRIDAAAETSGDTVSAVTETVQALDARLESLAAKLDTLDARISETAEAGTQAAAETATGGLETLERRLEETGQQLRTSFDEMVTNQKAALDAALAALTAERHTAAAPAAQDAAPAAAADDATPPEGLSSGNTAILADGAIRAFISRVDDAASAARLSINGELAHLTAGHSIAMRPGGEYCRVTLDRVDRGHALISAACGDDLPAPEGLTAGSTAVLGDGAARVFLSAASGDDSSARIAINGLDVQTVAPGETVAVGDTGCTVHVEQIDRGHVTFSYNC